MKPLKLIIAAAVIYKITPQPHTIMVYQCKDQALFDPLLNACVQKLAESNGFNRFDTKKAAEEFAKGLKAHKSEAYTVTDVHVLSEEDGEK